MKDIKLYAVFVFCLAMILGASIWFVTSQVREAYQARVSENERAAMVAGVVIGLDIAMALKGQPALDKTTWINLAEGFDKHTKDCQNMECMMERLMGLRESIRSKMQSQLGPEVLR